MYIVKHRFKDVYFIMCDEVEFFYVDQLIQYVKHRANKRKRRGREGTIYIVQLKNIMAIFLKSNLSMFVLMNNTHLPMKRSPLI